MLTKVVEHNEMELMVCFNVSNISRKV